MKAIDIALKDLTRSFRSAFAIVFMFVIPLLVTGMFYLMFGNSSSGDLQLPKTTVIVANLDEGGPRFEVSEKDFPGGKKTRTLGEMVVNVLESKDLADLVQVSTAPSAASARAAVDGQQAQVAVIIPPDFSKTFADANKKSTIEFYQDPTLTIGPEIIQAILNRFMDGMAGVKIALNVYLDEASDNDAMLAGQVIQQYLDSSLVQTKDLATALLDTRSSTAVAAPKQDSMLAQIVGPIMAGMLIFYAFYTGASTGQSILKEEDERTLPRMFTTPTPRTVILSGKFLSVFLTVLVQVTVLLLAAHFIFRIEWGNLALVGLTAIGTVFCAASFGICINSFLKNARQGGALFGVVLTLTGMLGMLSIIASGSVSASQIGTVSLFVPQGWAVEGLSAVMHGAQLVELLPYLAGLLVWGSVMFIIGIWRFNRRYV
ncbi:MAG TPA: ABC transporter permease [Anaerolineae bacterium]|nr:ABC transporter permease [Anaerolineae bacterium]